MTKPQAPLRPPQPPFVEELVRQHLRTNPELVTVCSTPNGITSYVLTGDDTEVRSVRHENGALVVRSRSERYGTLLSVLGGPAVVEVALHETTEQASTFRQVVAAVDKENLEQAMAAAASVFGSVAQLLGVTVEELDDEGEA